MLDKYNRLVEWPHCTAVAAEPRLRTLADGSTAVYRQCPRCGRAVGTALPKADFRLDLLPRWDDLPPTC